MVAQKKKKEKNLNTFKIKIIRRQKTEKPLPAPEKTSQINVDGTNATPDVKMMSQDAQVIYIENWPAD